MATEQEKTNVTIRNNAGQETEFTPDQLKQIFEEEFGSFRIPGTPIVRAAGTEWTVETFRIDPAIVPADQTERVFNDFGLLAHLTGRTLLSTGPQGYFFFRSPFVDPNLTTLENEALTAPQVMPQGTGGNKWREIWASAKPLLGVATKEAAGVVAKEVKWFWHDIRNSKKGTQNPPGNNP